MKAGSGTNENHLLGLGTNALCLWPYLARRESLMSLLSPSGLLARIRVEASLCKLSANMYSLGLSNEMTATAKAYRECAKKFMQLESDIEAELLAAKEKNEQV